MPDIHNSFRAALDDPEARPQIGLFLGLGSALSAELLAGTGFDWLLVDLEHGPNDVRSAMTQLQVLERRVGAVLVRTTDHDPARIKQLLDIGTTTLLVPMVDSADQAQALVRAVRYPPEGIRGVAPVLARAAQWGAVPDYLQRANRAVCLIVQVESAAGLQALPAILAVDGVDGVFIGPLDLAASMGFPGNPAHPRVREAVIQALRTIADSGKWAGVFAPGLADARLFCQAGARFVGIGADTLLLREAAHALTDRFREGLSSGPATDDGVA